MSQQSKSEQDYSSAKEKEEKNAKKFQSAVSSESPPSCQSPSGLRQVSIKSVTSLGFAITADHNSPFAAILFFLLRHNDHPRAAFLFFFLDTTSFARRNQFATFDAYK